MCGSVCMILSKGLYSKTAGREMSLKSVNEWACLSGATHCIHVPVRNTEPFIPRVHKHTHTDTHTHTHTHTHRTSHTLVLRTNLSLERKEGLGGRAGMGGGGWEAGW